MMGTRRGQWQWTVFVAGALVIMAGTRLSAQTTEPAQAAPEESKSAGEAPPEEQKAEANKAEPFTSKAWGVRVEPEPPSYVKTLDKSGIAGLEKLDWLEFGLEQCTRFELRDDDYRRDTLESDAQFLMRSRAYLGVRKVLDPFRFGIEFQDARQFHSDFPETNREVDEADLLQAFGELYFADALGPGYPVQFRAGRMTLEYVDRRQVGRNRWRNTTNAFDGFRVRLGQPTSDWQFDFFAVQPVDRRLRSFDPPDEERWLYGLVGAWRGWSKAIILEPYYLISDEDRKDPATADREIHVLGLHGYGMIADTAFDYDFDAAFQFGEDGDRKQRAFAVHGEAGYSFAHAWKPRLAFSTAYASGDRNPDDSLSERFDRLFQPGHPYSMADLFTWQNMISPKVRLALRPTAKLSTDLAYGPYWLAADSDAWTTTTRRDPAGESGDFVGQEIELRVRYKLDPRLELEAGYSHFMPGPFVRNTGPADDSDFFYVQTTLSF